MLGALGWRGCLRGVSGAAASAASRRPLAPAARAGARRWLGGHGGGGHGKPDPAYNNFVVPEVSQPHRRVAEGLCIMTWLWIFYRTYNDGKLVFLGIHPWDEEDSHGHHASDVLPALEWSTEIGVKPSLQTVLPDAAGHGEGDEEEEDHH
jgi:hypothetical protein